MARLSDIQLIQAPIISDRRGNLSFLESQRHLPFDFKRLYYLYDVPGGAARGGHAHINLQQFIVAISGSFDIVLDDGFERKRYHLNRSHTGLLLPNMIWRELDNFSSGSVCMVLASAYYEESDYIRDYSEYLKLVRGESQHEAPLG